MTFAEKAPALQAREVQKSFRRDNGEFCIALKRVSFSVPHAELTALVGPDGAGKTTLIRLAAGLMAADSGKLTVLGMDVSNKAQAVQERLGYMPQRFGLYEDLTVQENLDLYADLHGVTGEERSERYPRLMDMTGLGSFTARLAGKLSGGMKQKLGLACTLVRAPELLLLDEPTVGVDPLSRRELWQIILQLVHERGLTVLVSTSYLDEAERCGRTIVLHDGNVLTEGTPAEVSRLAAGRTFIAALAPGRRARSVQTQLLDDPEIVDAVPEGGKVRFVSKAGAPRGIRAESALAGAAVTPVEQRFEDGFMVLLEQTAQRERADLHVPALLGSSSFSGAGARYGAGDGTAVVVVEDLVRNFGSFTAVDHVSFQVRRGEIFGLLGPNGAGKTTTFRMLCGLLPASSGVLRVSGVDLRRARASARQRIGYVAQKFSLYSQLTVGENLEFFASAYSLRGARKEQRLAWALREFALGPLIDLPSGQLAGGYQRRLAMAAALMHQPETLFLDEPTSGADPFARREFWQRIVALAEQGVTVVVTTHFMEEAEYCDRVAILDAGRVLAQGAPSEIRLRARPDGVEPNMEDAFIAVVEEARQP
jgi:ABC-2 type transport system ATP-binding protein